MSLEPGARIEVLWLDSMGWAADWRDLDEAIEAIEKESMLQRTTGYVIKATDTYIAVAGSTNERRTRFAGIWQIPQVAIKKMTVFAPTTLEASDDG